MYTVKTSKLFQKNFLKLDAALQSRVLVSLERLSLDPFDGSKKLVNVKEGVYRIRIGDYRIRFDVEDKDIFLYCVRHRKDVYRK